MDTLTVSAIRLAYRAAAEELLRHVAAGRSAEFAVEASESFLAPRAAAALEAHDARRWVEHRPGKDFRAETLAGFVGAFQLLRTGKKFDAAWDFFWKRAAAAVQPRELF